MTSETMYNYKQMKHHSNFNSQFTHIQNSANNFLRTDRRMHGDKISQLPTTGPKTFATLLPVNLPDLDLVCDTKLHMAAIKGHSSIAALLKDKTNGDEEENEDDKEQDADEDDEEKDANED